MNCNVKICGYPGCQETWIEVSFLAAPQACVRTCVCVCECVPAAEGKRAVGSLVRLPQSWLCYCVTGPTFETDQHLLKMRRSGIGEIRVRLELIGNILFKPLPWSSNFVVAHPRVRACVVMWREKLEKYSPGEVTRAEKRGKDKPREKEENEHYSQ